MKRLSSGWTVVLGVSLLSVWGSVTWGQDAETLFQEGRNFLISFGQAPHDTNDLFRADQRFQQALQTNANHYGACIYRSVTRLVTLVYDAEVSQMLTDFGLPAAGRDLMDWAAEFPDPMPVNSPTSGEALTLAARKLSTEIDGALDCLDRISSNWTGFIEITAAEAPPLMDDDVEIDLGDVRAWSAALSALKALVSPWLAYNLDVDIAALVHTNVDISINDHILGAYPDLLTITNPAAMTTASNAVVAAVAYYMEASASIRNEVDDQSDDFLVIDPEDLDGEADFRVGLQKLLQSLSGPVVPSLDTGLEDTYGQTVHLGNFYGVPGVTRAHLPLVDAQNELIFGSFPDPTLSGLFPNMTQHLLARAFEFKWLHNDYDNDMRSDLPVFDRPSGAWYVLGYGDEIIDWNRPWGWPTAYPLAGNFDGRDGADYAVFDSSSGLWYVHSAEAGLLAWALPWGWPGATPLCGDFNGDGAADLAVYDNASGAWFTCTIDGTVVHGGVAWGWPGAIPLTGDFDGDGRDDFAVYDSNTGHWYVLSATGNAIAWALPWGWPGAIPVAGDFDGDVITDLAVFDGNTGSWYVYALDGRVLAWNVQWGWPGAVPVAGDYDGDGRTDFTVFDSNTGHWYILSALGSPLKWDVPWGWPGAAVVGVRQ